jgi:hypothetical protein
MKLIVLLACAIALLATLVQAGLQDEIDAALKKFCGGIAITGPTKGQTFTNPKKIKVTVSKYQTSNSIIIIV